MIQFILMILMLLNAFLFTQTSHPMAMGLILLFHTIMSCGLTGLMSKNFWFSYILFLIFIGGMLILFIYMASLASNEAMKFYPSTLIKFFIYLYVSILILFFLDKFLFINLFNNMEMNSLLFNSMLSENLLSLSKMYDTPNFNLIILMMNYLLLTLIIVVKITNIFLGPLRPKN